MSLYYPAIENLSHMLECDLMMLRPKKEHGGCDSVCSGGSQWDDDILVDVVFCVLEKLLEALDHVRFAAVCKRWNSIAKDYNRITQRWRSKQVLPMLMIPPRATLLSQGVTLYSVFERTMYNNVKLPVPANEKCCGFGHGWLASIDESLTNITLRRFPAAAQNDQLNVIHLPPLRDDYTKSLPKVVLFADPTLRPDSYIVSAIHGHQVACTIAEQQNSWSYLSVRIRGSCPKFVDAITFGSRVYLVDTWGSNLLRFDNSICCRIESLMNIQPQISPESCAYLVESTKGNLLVVERVRARKEVSATTFKVSQVVPDKSTNFTFGALLEVNSLGDEALFVCESHSISVLASNFVGCQPNSIYYAYNSGSTWEMGIFSLENKTTTQLHSLNHGESSDNMPFWIAPSFEGLCS